ncbi:hypothetical protein [Streptomyces sp. NPDC026589]|uniref:hypothetical protein n=1 Tax=Streptomyces sp. NPDC026589 TaxID=3155609 RepID=UPI0034090712
MNKPGGTLPRVRPADPSGPAAASTDGGRAVPFTGALTASSVTPNSRPAPAAPALGTITGATAVSTDPSVELTAPAPGGALGSAYSLARPAAGRTVPRFRSDEAASAASRPQLESHLRS